MAELDEIIRRLANRPGMNQTRLAEVLGLPRQSITKILKREQTNLPIERLRALAQRFPDAATEILSLPSQEDDSSKGKNNPGEPPAMLREEAEYDFIPIFSFVPEPDGPPAKKVVGNRLRPPILQSVRDAYAVYVPDDSMVPCYHKGWVVYVNPHRPVPDDRDALIFFKTNRAPVIRRVNSKARGKRVAETLSTKDRPIPEGDIADMHLIVSADHEG